MNNGFQQMWAKIKVYGTMHSYIKGTFAFIIYQSTKNQNWIKVLKQLAFNFKGDNFSSIYIKNYPLLPLNPQNIPKFGIYSCYLNYIE